MGGVMSAAGVAFWRSEGKTVDEVTRAMFRASIMGGATMCSVNMLSAWSCSQAASKLTKAAATPIEKAMNMQGADCLTGNCHAEQMQWALIAVLTAAIGLCASLQRSRNLGFAFLAMWAFRGASTLMSLMLAAYDSTSCASWTMASTYWMPVVSLSCSVSFMGLALKFTRVVRVIDGSGGSSSAPEVDMSVFTDALAGDAAGPKDH